MATIGRRFNSHKAFEEFEIRIERLVKNSDLDDDEYVQEFLLTISDRLKQYGPNTYLTDKQFEYVDQLEARVA